MNANAQAGRTPPWQSSQPPLLQRGANGKGRLRLVSGCMLNMLTVAGAAQIATRLLQARILFPI